MMASNRPLRLAGLVTAAWIAIASPGPASAQGLEIGSFQKVGETRITRTISEFTYRASLTNSGPALPGAEATVVSLSPSTSLVDGSLTFGAVGTSATVQSQDTFTFRHDRTVPFDWSVLQWTVTAAPNRAPVADAGADQTVAPGTTAQLDGSSSIDADGDPLTFAWSFASKPPGSAAALLNPQTVNPTFVVDVPGTYVVMLIVNDGSADGAPDTVVIDTTNSPPVADAGRDQTVPVGNTVTLDGSGSTDADGDALAFAWSVVSRPPTSAAALNDLAAVQPTFTVDRPGVYVMQLVVNDGSASSDPDTVTISTTNSPPVADAGADRTAAIGELVALDGGGSSDADGDTLAFSWSLTSRPSGSVAVLSGAASVAASFTPDVPGVYVVQLIVNDGQADSAPDSVEIATGNSAPIANAGPDRTVDVGAVVELDGSASSDPDGTPLEFSWSLTAVPAGSTAALTGATTAQPSFVADLPGTYVAQLIVGDGTLSSEPDTVAITTNLPRVAVLASDPDASEAGDPGAFTISRTGPTTSALTVTYALSGTADNGADYVALSGSLTIPAGAASAPLEVIPLDDSLFEPPERVILNLVAAPAYDLGLDQASVTIVDDELPAVTIVAADETAAEAGRVPGRFIVERTGPVTDPLTVFYTTAGAAINGTDYDTLPGSITIPAGSATATVTIAPIDDDLFEDPELAILSLSPRPEYEVVVPGIAGLTILDDDGAVVTIVATDAAASEATGDPGAFTITRTGGDLASALIVLVARSGTANNGSDYASLGGATFAVTIPANETSVVIVITPLPDAAAEGDETVTLTISPRAVYVIGTPGSATVTISGP